MKTMQIATLTLLLGGVIGYSASQFLAHDMSSMKMKTDYQENLAEGKEPIYWVAPMDANYTRDKPGKSPMGMDLIPVYEDSPSTGNEKAGTIMINPAVENNLGVKTQKVARSALSAQIETLGYITFDESKLWQTNVRVAGWVQALFINAVGEQVKKGDVLFTLYSPDLVKAQEELLNAHRTNRKARIKGARERLLTLGVDREQIAKIEKAGISSQEIEIKAISDGVIATHNIREGAYLSPSQSVLSAAPLDSVWVDTDVFERQAHWVKTGNVASMTLEAFPGKTWQGKIDYVYPIVDPKSRTLRVRLVFDNQNGELKPNMFARIYLQASSNEPVLNIPKNAVIRSGNMTRVVLALGEGKFRSARVEVGREAGDTIEIRQGLTKNDTVVTSAHFLLDSESSQSADFSRINGLALMGVQ